MKAMRVQKGEVDAAIFVLKEALGPALPQEELLGLQGRGDRQGARHSGGGAGPAGRGDGQGAGHSGSEVGGRGGEMAGEARQAVRQGSVGEVNNNVVPQLVKQRPRLAPSMYHLAW